MKKYIIRLIICLVLLIGLLFLAKLIRSRVDDVVENQVPVQDTEVTLDTGAFIIITDPVLGTDGETGNGGNTGSTGNNSNTGTTDPSGTTDPNGSSDPTDPSGTTPTTPNGSDPTDGTTPTTPTTAPPTTTTPKKGQTVPPIVFYTADDGAVTFEIYKDKPVIVCLWASWASGSEATLNMLQEAYNLHSDKLYVVAINMTNSPRETKEDAQAFWDSHNYTFPTYFDNDGTAQALFQVNTVPTTFFLKKDNLAIAYFKGNLTRYALRIGLKELLEN